MAEKQCCDDILLYSSCESERTIVETKQCRFVCDNKSADFREVRMYNIRNELVSVKIQHCCTQIVFGSNPFNLEFTPLLVCNYYEKTESCAEKHSILFHLERCNGKKHFVYCAKTNLKYTYVCTFDCIKFVEELVSIEANFFSKTE